jgi:hypothetical protein
MALHQELSGTEIHTPFAFVYADATARENATGLTSSDVNKLALQEDNHTVWVLTDASGPTWVPVSKDMSASDILAMLKTVDGTGSGLDADTVDGKHASSFALVDHTHSEYATYTALASKAPIPTSASSVGQWRREMYEDGTTHSTKCPSGGTWAYFIPNLSIVGICAGGTVFSSNTKAFSLFWRIA